MRILVVSDTHRDSWSLQEAILRQPKAEVVIHLGDGADEAEMIKQKFPEKQFYMVRGNCDWSCNLPMEQIVTLEGRRIFFTHGYAQNVKYGLYQLKSEAREQGADVALFGHTHESMTDYEDGLYLMNPGSLHGMDATYGIIALTTARFVITIVRLENRVW